MGGGEEGVPFVFILLHSGGGGEKTVIQIQRVFWMSLQTKY